jgi:hypothetical protein
MRYGILLLISVMFFTVSCNNTSNKLKGIWKVSKVDTKFDENTMTPEMIKQVVDLQKKTYFKILDDSSMVIISDNNPFDARWFIDEDNVITYRFKNSVTKPNVLGKFEKGIIKSETKTPLGKIVIYYEKE